MFRFRNLAWPLLAALVLAHPAAAQIGTSVIPAQSAVTIANGVDTRAAVFDVRGYSSVTLVLQNSDAADAWANGRIDVAVTGGTAAPALAAVDWAPLNATDYPTVTTMATLASLATTYLSLDTRGIVWIQVVAQGNAADSAAIIQFSGVPRAS